MTAIDKDLETLANHPWTSFSKSASVVEGGVREYYANPSVGRYTYPQYLHARHVLGLDGEAKKESDMHPDLEWLARNVSEWIGAFKFVGIARSEPFWAYRRTETCEYSKSQWLQARQDLGLVMTEGEAELPAKEHRNKYMREIKPCVWVDVYDVLAAWDVRNAALQHLIKKALAPGQRGHKTLEQDMDDIVASAERARELGE